MKNIKRIILFFVALALFAIIFTPTVSNADTTQINSEDSLIEAINTATDEDIIQLTTSIELTRPLEITNKTITINGNGNTISRNTNNWSANGANATLITAGIESEVTLTNLNLTNSAKYGAQAYNGGYLILDNVTIGDCEFGGVLVNAGTLEIIDLFLQKNGQSSNNGIEIAKSSTISESDNEPTLIMNGRLSSTQTENVIYLAVDDDLATFNIVNKENTINKILGDGNRVVITDQNNNVIYESNISEGLDIAGQTYVENIVITVYLMDQNISFTVPQGTILTKAQIEERINLETLGLTGYAIEEFFTDEAYTTVYNFETPFADSTTLYAKLVTIEMQPKDVSPKTGIEDYLGIPVLVIVISVVGIVTLKRKEF